MRVLILAILASAAAFAQITQIPAATGGGGGTQWGGVYTAATTNTLASPYAHSVTAQATGNFGTDFAHANNWSDTTWMQFGTNYEIRHAGNVAQIQFSWGNPTTTNQYTGVYFVICRPSVSASNWNQIPNDCPVVQKSANLLSLLTAGQINTVNFCASGCSAGLPIPVKKGDFYGFESTGTFGTGGAIDDRFHADASVCQNGNNTTDCYLATTASTLNPQAFPWNTTSTWTFGNGFSGGTNMAVPVSVYLQQGPAFVMIGDSIIAGQPRQPGIYTSADRNFAKVDATSDIGWHIRHATGWTYQNMGIGGQTTTQIAARFATDCVALHPQFCIIEGGVNDIAQGGANTLANFQTQWTSMLTAAKNAGITPVCLLILPWQGASTGQGQSMDTWNAWLNGQCEQYAGFTVDTRPYVGQFRSGGSTDNLWNIKPEYMSVGDNLQIHYDSLGYKAIARAILERMGITTSETIIQKKGAWFMKAQSQSASISAGTYSVYCLTDIPWMPSRCESGLYRLTIYMSPMTTNAGATVTATFTYKDTGTPGNSGNSYSVTTSSLDLSSVANNIGVQYNVVLDGLTDPTIATTYAGTTATYQIYAALERVD